MSTPAEQITGFDPLEIPNLSEQGLYDYLRGELGVPIGRNAVRTAVRDGEIKPTEISGKFSYSRSDGLNWLKTRKRS